MSKKVLLEPLDVENWLKVCDLSVSDAQKKIFPIPNVYWIRISRYEEKTDLFAIKNGDAYVGFIGGGLDPEYLGSGWINPLMVDARHQGNGYAKAAVLRMIDHLHKNFHVNRINISHRKENQTAGQLYESLGFVPFGGDEKNKYVMYNFTDKPSFPKYD